MQSLQRTIKRRLAEAIQKGDLAGVEDLMPLIQKALDKPNNLALMSDGYKYSHHGFYPDKTTKVCSYLESRGGKFDSTVFYGLQIFLKEFLEGVAITTEEIDEAEAILAKSFNRDDVFDRSKFDYIVEKHGGRLPVRIKAVPEGTVVSTKNVLMIIENTDDNCAWLTNFLETILLQVWYPITVATLSREVRKISTKYYRLTSDLPIETQEFLLGFTLNDFGFRGVSSVQSARNGGSAHLVMHDGGDTTIASKVTRDIYNSEVTNQTIPATEHSIMTIRGEEGEIEMMKQVLLKYPTGLVACVSDSYNIFRACADYWGGELKDLILSRPAEPGNALVIRPDSGHPARTLQEIFKILFDKFGYTTNSKGFKVLPPQVRVIQGDGVNINSIEEIYEMLFDQGIAAENLVFGMGGKLLQADINRDTQNFATKACFAIIDGEEIDVVKSPTEIDENGEFIKSFKKSKQGRLKLVKTLDGHKTITSKDEGFEEAQDEMVTVFENGEITTEWKFEEIRDRARLQPVEVEALVTSA